MRRFRLRHAPGAVLVVAAALSCAGAVRGAGPSSADTSWELVVPAGRLGRFALRIERAEFAGPVSQVAARVTGAWGDEPWLVIGPGRETGPVLSRLTPSGIETIDLRPGTNGRVEARRSRLDWRGEHAAALAAAPEPVFVAALAALGEPLSGFASVDGGAGNLTRVWLVPGEIAAVSRQVERIAATHGLSPLMRFDAPGDAPAVLRGGRVIAFGGPDLVTVLTFTRHETGVAVVVHCQERTP